MSRAVPLDHAFDKVKFAELLKRAQGDRQQNTFADDIGMSKTYLNSYLGAKNDKPLTPSTIKKIAAASDNRVSYAELLEASGYNPDKYSKGFIKSYEEIKNSYDAQHDKIEARINSITGTITTALANKGYKWSGKNIEDNQFDFAITLYDMPINAWYFIYIGKTPLLLREHSTQLHSYGLQLLKMMKPGEKISFVTDNEDDYKQLQKQELPASQIYASSILVDTDNLSVRKENFIKTACEYSKKIPSLL